MFESLVLRLLVPPLCPACGGPAGEGRFVCSKCFLRLTSEPPVAGRPPTGVAEVASAFRHESVARDLLNVFKFSSGVSLAPFLASQMLERCEAALTGGTLVPVPASVAGLASRGFDTADLLAREISRSMPDLETRPGLLERPPGVRQLGRSRRERLAGGRGIVATSRLEGVAVLVDDVLTTGATLGSSARALRRAGAGTVRAVTFTRRT